MKTYIFLILIIVSTSRIAVAEVYRSMARSVVTTNEKVVEYKIEKNGAMATVIRRDGGGTVQKKTPISECEPYLYGITHELDLSRKEIVLKFGDVTTRLKISYKRREARHLVGREVAVVDFVVSGGTNSWVGIGKVILDTSDGYKILEMFELKKKDIRVSYSEAGRT